MKRSSLLLILFCFLLLSLLGGCGKRKGLDIDYKKYVGLQMCVSDENLSLFSKENKPLSSFEDLIASEEYAVEYLKGATDFNSNDTTFILIKFREGVYNERKYEISKWFLGLKKNHFDGKPLYSVTIIDEELPICKD